MVGLCVVGFVLGQFQNASRESGKADLFSNAVQVAVGPPTRATNASMGFIGDLLTGLRDAKTLRMENERLLAVEENFKRYQEDYDALNGRYEALRGEVNYPVPEKRDKVFAKIVAFMPFQNRVTLDRGGDSGIGPHMPVVSAKGLVGIVETVSADSCQVLLITSPALRVAVKVVGEPDVPGLARGETPTRLVIELFESEVVHTGQSVVTSGFSLLVPPGIPIGTIIDSRDDPQFGVRRVFVHPAVDIGEVGEVFVVR